MRKTITAEAADRPPPRLRRSANARRAKAELAEEFLGKISARSALSAVNVVRVR
jgi:hypothetical protein